MWSPIPSQRILYQQGMQPHQQMVPQHHAPPQGIQQNPNGMPISMQQSPHYQHNHPHHHHHHQQQRYRNNGMMNVHRKNMRRNRGGPHNPDDADKYVNAKVQDFTGSILSLCKDQHGCRFLQRELYNETNTDLIFNEICPKISELMIDPFGNYLVQKLFEMVNSDQRLILIKNTSSELLRISLDPHGTRAFQKLIDVIETEEEINIIIDKVSPHVVTLIYDSNGNHLIQKIITKLAPEIFYEIICDNLFSIACHRHGCCVLQKCLDHGSESQRKQLSLEISKYTFELSLDPFGNYVIQYILKKGDKESIDTLLEKIKFNLINLCTNKFGSNIIECLLRIPILSTELINCLIEKSDEFYKMVNDPFGNYVIQTSLDVSNVEQFEKLKLALLPLLPNIKNTPHGRRILNKLQ